MRRYYYLLCFALVVVSAGFGQQVETGADPSGGTPYADTAQTMCTFTVLNWDSPSQTWLCQITVSSSGHFSNGTAATGSGSFNQISGGTGAAGQALSYTGYEYPSYTANLNVANTGGGQSNSVSVTTPPPPAQPKNASAAILNTSPVGQVFFATDAATGVMIPGTAIYVPAGGTATMNVGSNGNDIQIQSVTQTLAQYNASSGYGTGNIDSSGNLISGGASLLDNYLYIPYASMQNSNTQSNYTGDPNGDTIQPITAPTVASGSSVGTPGESINNLISGSVVAGASNVGNAGVIFAPGTGSNQTGNTSGLTNGQFNQGINGLAQTDAQGFAGVIQSIQNWLAGSGGTGTGSGSGIMVTFPSSIGINNFPSSIAISNYPSGGTSGTVSVVFPSSISISNFPSGYGAVNFPSEMYVGNLPSNYPDAAAISALNILVSANAYMNGQVTTIRTDSDSMVSSLNTIAAIFAPSTAFDVSGTAAGNHSAIAGIVSGNAWGNAAAPGSPGSPGTFTLPSGNPPDTPGYGGSAPSSGFTAPVLSFNPTAQIWAGASVILSTGRPFLAFALSLMFIARCGKIMQQYVIGLCSVPQYTNLWGPEVLVPGVANAKMIVGCSLVTAAMAAAIAAILLVITGSLSGSASLAAGALSAVTGTNGGLDFTSLGYGLAIVNQYVPCALIGAYAVLSASLYFWTAPIYAAAAAVIKFLVL